MTIMSTPNNNQRYVQNKVCRKRACLGRCLSSCAKFLAIVKSVTPLAVAHDKPSLNIG